LCDQGGVLELWNDAPDGITYCVAEQNTMTRPYGLLFSVTIVSGFIIPISICLLFTVSILIAVTYFIISFVYTYYLV
jgi:hypothetical protein